MIQHEFKPGDLVDFTVVKDDEKGTYHGAIYINDELVLIGDGRETYAQARADSDAEEKSFRQAVKFEDVSAQLHNQPSDMVH
jgi:hypothetical protein